VNRRDGVSKKTLQEFLKGRGGKSTVLTTEVRFGSSSEQAGKEGGGSLSRTRAGNLGIRRRI